MSRRNIFTLLAASASAAALAIFGFHDPEIEFAPGRSMPRSLLRKIVVMWGIDHNGNSYEWRNPNPLP